jgi:hypothetical protein
VEVIRFARGLVPLAAIALLGAPGMIGPPAVGASAPWQPPPCPPEAPVMSPAGTAWYRLDAVLDGSGTWPAGG